jgi:hypothetical protein
MNRFQSNRFWFTTHQFCLLIDHIRSNHIDRLIACIFQTGQLRAVQNLCQVLLTYRTFNLVKILLQKVWNTISAKKSPNSNVLFLTRFLIRNQFWSCVCLSVNWRLNIKSSQKGPFLRHENVIWNEFCQIKILERQTFWCFSNCQNEHDLLIV